MSFKASSKNAINSLAVGLKKGFDFIISWCLFKSILYYFFIMFIGMFSYFILSKHLLQQPDKQGLLSRISACVFFVLQDPKYFKSQKTGRGQLKEGWRDTQMRKKHFATYYLSDVYYCLPQLFIVLLLFTTDSIMIICWIAGASNQISFELLVFSSAG